MAPERPLHRRRYITDHNEHHSDAPCPTTLEEDLRTDLSSTHIPPMRIDVLNWLGRATLDVIGLAGFGYAFDSLIDDRNILATAFAEIFSAARSFRFIIVLQAWFPILRYFVSTSAASYPCRRAGGHVCISRHGHAADIAAACQSQSYGSFAWNDASDRYGPHTHRAGASRVLRGGAKRFRLSSLGRGGTDN